MKIEIPDDDVDQLIMVLNDKLVRTNVVRLYSLQPIDRLLWALKNGERAPEKTE